MKDLNAALDRPVPGRLLRQMERCGWVRRRKALLGGRTRPKQEKVVRLLSAEIPGARLTAQRQAVTAYLDEHGDTPLRELGRYIIERAH